MQKQFLDRPLLGSGMSIGPPMSGSNNKGAQDQSQDMIKMQKEINKFMMSEKRPSAGGSTTNSKKRNGNNSQNTTNSNMLGTTNFNNFNNLSNLTTSTPEK